MLFRPKTRRISYPALGFAIPFLSLLGVMIVSGYTPFGNYSMLYSDMYHQYYPFFVAFHRALRSGTGLLYSWDVGMGIDYLSLISYYLASPLYLLSVLVPEGWLLSYFSLLVPVKLGLAGLFCSLFLKKTFGRDDFSVSVFGAFYGLCAWALGYQWNIMWLDTFALLPLVCLGTLSLIREKKVFLYTITLFLAVYSNYYIGLFVCIFVALVFFCYELCRFAGWKRFFLDLLRIALFSGLAIGMTFLLTVPTLAALQTTQSSVNKFPNGFKLNIAKENTWRGLLSAMRKVTGNMGGALEPSFKEGLPNLYCGVGSLLFALLYLQARDVKRRDKLASVGLLLFFNVSFIIRQLDYIWHGFHFTNMIPYRFSFLYSFVLLTMAYQGWIRRGQFRPLQIASAICFTAAIFCCSDSLMDTQKAELFGLSFSVPVYCLYNFGFLTLYAVALFYGCRRMKPADAADPYQRRLARYYTCLYRKYARTFFLGVATAELIATVISFGLYFPGTHVANYPKGREDSASIVRYMKERRSWDLFFRAEVTHAQTLNDGALNAYHGISTFTSSANVHITYFLEALGYGAKNTYNRYCFEESSPVANLFLNLEYMIDRDGADRSNAYFEKIFSVGQASLLENKAYLPLGFLAEPELQSVDFLEKNANPFYFQNELFSAAAGLENSVFLPLRDGSLTITGEGVEVQNKGGGEASYTKATSGSAVLYDYNVTEAGVLCIHLDCPKRNEIQVYVNDAEQYRETLSLPQMLSVGDVVPGDRVRIRIICKNGDSSTTKVKAAVVDPQVFAAGYEKLAGSTLTLTEFKNTYMKGKIDCNRDGLLYTSVPQNGNWKMKVDGVYTETKLVGDCMVAADLREGSHTVELIYENQAFNISWKISLACFLIFLGIWYRWYRQKPEFLPEPEEEVPPEGEHTPEEAPASEENVLPEDIPEALPESTEPESTEPEESPET